MKKRLLWLYTLLYIGAGSMTAQHQMLTDDIKSLQAIVNGDWLSPAVMTMGGQDVLDVSFDRMSHAYHPMSYHIDHCEADWTLSEEIFQSDWLEGFNDQPIEDYAASMNTTVPYMHYSMQIPNELTRLTMSGNYLLTITDNETDEEVVKVRFMVVEPRVSVSMAATTNTDIDVNQQHQQVSMAINYGSINVTNPEEQIYTVVTQNQQWSEGVKNPRPNLRNINELEWTHNRQLIFPANNEYRKFEILDVSHTTMGLERITWDGAAYNAYPFTDEPRRNYLTDEDADGAFLIRNSDNIEVSTTCDYVRVCYQLKSDPLPGDVVVSGQWTTATNPSAYLMTYDYDSHCYRATIWQKQGYYNYQYRLRQPDGSTKIAPTEGCFYQASNRYQAYVYYKGTGERTWKLVGYRQLIF